MRKMLDKISILWDLRQKRKLENKTQLLGFENHHIQTENEALNMRNAKAHTDTYN